MYLATKLLNPEIFQGGYKKSKYFEGFISFLRIKDTFYHFATYTRAAIRQLEYKNDYLYILVEDKKHELHIKAKYSTDSILKAPKNRMMNRDISESISAIVDIELFNADKQLIFSGTGYNAGMEIAGDIFQYFKHLNM